MKQPAVDLVKSISGDQHCLSGGQQFEYPIWSETVVLTPLLAVLN